jgi:hypothetical protein
LVGESELVRKLLWFSTCESLLLETGSGGTGMVWKPRVRGTPTVGSRYQGEATEDVTVDTRLCVIVIYKV